MNITTRRGGIAGVAAIALATGSLLAACGSDDTIADNAAASTTAVASATGTTVGPLEITGAWARSSPSMASAGAAYLKVANSGDTDDALVSVSVDPSVAAKVEMHETTSMDDHSDGSDAMSSTTAGESPMMKMHAVDKIAVPASGDVALEPGGFHIMILDLAKPLEVGSTIELNLTFEKAGEVKVSAPVRDTPP